MDGIQHGLGARRNEKRDPDPVSPSLQLRRHGRLKPPHLPMEDGQPQGVTAEFKRIETRSRSNAEPAHGQPRLVCHDAGRHRRDVEVRTADKLDRPHPLRRVAPGRALRVGPPWQARDREAEHGTAYPTGRGNVRAAHSVKCKGTVAFACFSQAGCSWTVHTVSIDY